MLPILIFIAGIMLALRFNVIILLPAVLFIWMIAIADGVATASSIASIVLQMTLLAVALQIGFVVGLVLEWAVLVGRRHLEIGKATTARAVH